MGHQETEFLKGEGDAWHLRNVDKVKRTPVLQAIITLPSFKKVIEFGCGDGINIGRIQLADDCEAVGIDPSEKAIAAARKIYPKVKFIAGTASYRFLLIKGYDLVIYGFCLYLCDRETLSHVVSVGDLALQDGGHLIIHDFDPEHPHKVPYHHKDGLFSYKMDHSKLWLANPAYSLVSKTIIPDDTAIWVLKKNIAAGWSEEKL